MLCSRIEALASGNCKKEERKIESRCSALSGQCVCSHVTAMTAATECGLEVLPYPPYSPDMAASDFYMFPKLKSNLCGTQFGSQEGIIAAVNMYLEDQEKDFYLEGINKLEQRWTKCIALKGDYIEK